MDDLICIREHLAFAVFRITGQKWMTEKEGRMEKGEEEKKAEAGKKIEVQNSNQKLC